MYHVHLFILHQAHLACELAPLQLRVHAAPLVGDLDAVIATSGHVVQQHRPRTQRSGLAAEVVPLMHVGIQEHTQLVVQALQVLDVFERTGLLALVVGLMVDVNIDDSHGDQAKHERLAVFLEAY